MFSIRLMIKYRHEDAPDPVSVVQGILNDIQYPREAVPFSVTETRVKDGFGYLLLEVASDDRQTGKDACETISGSADFLYRYLDEWVRRVDAVFASIHTSLEPLAFSDLDVESFPSRIGWITYFGSSLCDAVGKELLLGARYLMCNAWQKKDRCGVFWKITGSILERSAGSGRINGLYNYMGKNQFRLMHLVEESCHSLHYTITGAAVFSAVSDNIVSTFQDILCCDLEQYKDLWGTVDGCVFGAKASLGYDEGGDGYECTLSVQGDLPGTWSRDIIEIDITDYLYTLIRLHSMTPDPLPAGIMYRKPKNTMYGLRARLEFKHALPLETLSLLVLKVFDCSDHKVHKETLTMKMMGLCVTLTWTHTFQTSHYYVLSVDTEGPVTNDWRYIDISGYIHSLLMKGGVLSDREMVF